MSLLFRNFRAASSKRNMARFGLFRPDQDLSWIDNAPQDTLQISSVAYSATPAFDASLGQILTITLTGDVTASSLNYAGSASIPVGTKVELRITQDATGNHAFVLPPDLVIDQLYAIDPGAGRTSVLCIERVGNQWVFATVPFSVTGL